MINHNEWVEIEPIWKEILAAAVLGTERQPFTLPAMPEALQAVLTRADPKAAQPDDEAALLAAAGVLGLYRRAGWRPARDHQPLPPACQPDGQPPCSPRAARRLDLILTSEAYRLLPEWLRFLRARGERLPEKYLARLLDLGSSRPELREYLLPILGERGRWLAALRAAAENDPGWEWAAPLEPETVWNTARPELRRQAFRQLRRHHPQAALELLGSTWKQEPAAERARFLAMLIDGLNAADEPFLEAALDDRSKEVRQAAVDLLARLPGSGLVQRAAARLEGLLTYDPGRPPARPAALVVTLPEDCDAAMRREGADGSAPLELGERARWLFNLLAAVPPAHWSARWGLPPQSILDLAAQGEWQELLQKAWALAARRCPDEAWLRALLRIFEYDHTLLAAIPETVQPAVLIEALDSMPHDAGLVLVKQYTQPWSLALSRAVLRYLRRCDRAFNQQLGSSGRFSWIEDMAIYMDPAVLPEATHILNGAGEPGSAWERAIDHIFETLQFRLEMHKEFAEP